MIDVHDSTATAEASRDRYADVNTGWPEPMPPCTREEARRAASKLARAFGYPDAARMRRCWIALRPPFGSLNRGWRRLVHDISHRVFRNRNAQHGASRSRRPHHPQHAKLETEMMRYVLERNWLSGGLKPATKPVATLADKRAAKLASITAAIERWERKRKRAETALAKLRRRERYYAALRP